MKIAVIGAGLMGRAAAFDFTRAENVELVGVFDINENLARDVANRFGDEKTISGRIDASDPEAAKNLFSNYDAVLSCVTYKYNPGLTKAAIEAGCHFVDLGGNNDVVQSQLDMDLQAEEAGVVIIPDCGLAPGFVSILVADGVSKLEKVESVRIRVGGLPQSPRPPLNYQMLFSAEGLINEYWEPCIVLEDGVKKTVNPMTGLELLNFDGIGQLEAFYTSGGASTLPDTYLGKVADLDYKTIRYPGHCQLLKPMLEIGLASRQPIVVGDTKIEPREVFKAILEKNLSFDEPDIALVRVTVEGEQDGSTKTIEYEIIDRQDSRSGLSAMMRMTAFPAAIVTWLAASGQIDVRGCKPQEVAINPKLFIPQLKKRGINLTIRD